MNVLADIAQHFSLRSQLQECQSLKIGNVHSSWLLKCQGGVRYLLQKINDHVFSQPALLMENVNNVCQHLAEHPLAGYRDLYLVPTQQGSYFHRDQLGAYWRCFPYIGHSRFFNSSKDPEIIETAARAFALFLYRLNDYTLPFPLASILDFHDAELRFQQLETACSEDRCKRKKHCRAEIDFFFSRETASKKLACMLKTGELPLRLCHNDTKLNNVLFALKRNQVISVLDLDTVMEGSILYDFGDFVRSCGSGYAEDTENSSNATLKIELYQAALKGFVEGYSPLFTQKEYQLLPESIRIMSLIIGSRFLTDYLNGDRYFKIVHPKHNLIRTRNQVSFVYSLEEQFPLMLSHLENMQRSF